MPENLNPGQPCDKPSNWGVKGSRSISLMYQSDYYSSLLKIKCNRCHFKNDLSCQKGPISISVDSVDSIYSVCRRYLPSFGCEMAGRHISAQPFHNPITFSHRSQQQKSIKCPTLRLIPSCLTHIPREPHIGVNVFVIIGPKNGVGPSRRQSIS